MRGINDFPDEFLGQILAYQNPRDHGETFAHHKKTLYIDEIEQCVIEDYYRVSMLLKKPYQLLPPRSPMDLCFPIVTEDVLQCYRCQWLIVS